MKPKSFKSKEGGENDIAYRVSPKEKLVEQLNPVHFCFGVDQLRIDSNEQIKIQRSLLDAKDPDWDFDVFGLDDIVAITIDTNSQVLLAIVTDIVQVDDRWQALLGEYIPTQQPLRSSKSKQTPSPQWKSFLKELKKKCGSGHHNKKQKTLLHGVRMAKALAAKTASIKLTVRPDPDEVVGNARDIVGQIEEAIAEAHKAGERVSLDEIGEIFSEDQEIQVVDANYFLERTPAEAITYVMNGVPVRREYLAEPIETIRISKQLLDNAVKVHTGEPLSLSDQEVSWIVTAYSNSQGLTTHDGITIKNISLSPNGHYYELELEAGLEARAQAPLWDNKHLVAIYGYKPVIAEPEAVEEGWFENNYDKHDRPFDGTLVIAPGMYELLAESNDDPPPIRITYPLTPKILSRFKKGNSYFVSVDNTHSAAYRVDSVIIDAVEEKATVNFVYKGGDMLFPFDLREEELTMKKLSEASPKRVEAITLTIENGHGLPLPDDAGVDAAVDGNDGAATLEKIEAEMSALIAQVKDGIPLAEVADWITENHQQLNLMVTGAGYGAQQNGYATSSSVTGIAEIDVFESRDGKYKIIDLISELEKVNSLVNISRLAEDAPEPTSEVKGRPLVEELDEMRWRADIREAQLDVVPGVNYEVNVYMSIYNGDVGHAVCNNEKIYRILRKKKDGKCIYRIVMKKGVRANRIAHGKHRKCVMFIDRYSPVVEPVE